MKTMHAALVATLLAGMVPALAGAQDYNYVPGWANTHNHSYKGSGGGGEWQAKTELFAKLAARGPAAQCTLKNLSEAEGNTIVNRYRREARKSSEAAALRSAQAQLEQHHRQLKARGQC